jgi:hypothetical protein
MLNLKPGAHVSRNGPANGAAIFFCGVWAQWTGSGVRHTQSEARHGVTWSRPAGLRLMQQHVRDDSLAVCVGRKEAHGMAIEVHLTGYIGQLYA